MGFEEEKNQPGRERQDAPPVPDDLHVPVAGEVGDRKGVQLPRPEFPSHRVGRQDGDADVPEDGFLLAASGSSLPTGVSRPVVSRRACRCRSRIRRA
jgi:hypothetical protein